MPATVASALSTHEKLIRARAAATTLAQLSSEQKNAMLRAMADAIASHAKSILAANRKDVESSGLEGAMLDRLLLTAERIERAKRLTLSRSPTTSC
jgi:glutamate-5-semialdehyde dehydrogenase